MVPRIQLSISGKRLKPDFNLSSISDLYVLQWPFGVLPLAIDTHDMDVSMHLFPDSTTKSFQPWKLGLGLSCYKAFPK